MEPPSQTRHRGLTFGEEALESQAARARASREHPKLGRLGRMDGGLVEDEDLEPEVDAELPAEPGFGELARLSHEIAIVRAELLLLPRIVGDEDYLYLGLGPHLVQRVVVDDRRLDVIVLVALPDAEPLLGLAKIGIVLAPAPDESAKFLPDRLERAIGLAVHADKDAGSRARAQAA